MLLVFSPFPTGEPVAPSPGLFALEYSISMETKKTTSSTTRLVTIPQYPQDMDDLPLPLTGAAVSPFSQEP
ncbi:MAG: hypothetical protein EPO64_12100 [Nitrospirae bacterium]|nr:MAG: hypothetical protein EPO64_12100 [Nitrospirota bacterium]